MMFNPLISVTVAPDSLLPGFRLFYSYGLSHLHFSVYANLPKFLNCMFLVQAINFLRAVFTFSFSHLQVIQAQY